MNHDLRWGTDGMLASSEYSNHKRKKQKIYKSILITPIYGS